MCDISAEFYLNFKLIIIKIIMYSHCSITSFKHLWFIFKNIWSFSWNGNGNKRHYQWNFRKIIVKNKSKRKINFIIHHFLVKRKPHERIGLLITTSVNIYQTKKSSSNENMLFWRKTDETISKTPLSKGIPPPPFQLTLLFLINFFITPLFGQILKTRNSPPPI